MNLYIYIIKKIVLLQKTKYKDKTFLKQYIWQELNSKLMSSVYLKLNEFFNYFVKHLYQRKFAAQQQ